MYSCLLLACVMRAIVATWTSASVDRGKRLKVIEMSWTETSQQAGKMVPVTYFNPHSRMAPVSTEQQPARWQDALRDATEGVCLLVGEPEQT